MFLSALIARNRRRSFALCSFAISHKMFFAILWLFSIVGVFMSCALLSGHRPLYFGVIEVAVNSPALYTGWETCADTTIGTDGKFYRFVQGELYLKAVTRFVVER